MQTERIDAELLNQAIDLLALAQADTTLRRKTQSGEYGGPCPFCGGRDRFSVQAGRWLCRHCTDGKWRDGIAYVMRRQQCGFRDVAEQYGAAKPDPSVIAKRQALQAAEESRRVAELAEHLARYTHEERWAAMHAVMAEEQRQWWRMQGIPDSWQDYLQLGYVPDKTYREGEEERHSPAYTIPYFHNSTAGREFRTLQYRLTNPENPADRYRFEFGLPATYYHVTATQPIGNIAIICEGAKKAAVTHIHTDPKPQTSILAVPGKASWGGVVEAVRECGRVYVILDPDGEQQARKLAREIGKTARVVRLHGKIDDLLAGGQMDKADLRSALRWADRETE